jgi:hypothetical protein
MMVQWPKLVANKLNKKIKSVHALQFQISTILFNITLPIRLGSPSVLFFIFPHQPSLQISLLLHKWHMPRLSDPRLGQPENEPCSKQS